MPIYEYQCPQCQRVFEEWVKAADAHGQEPCPDCGAASPRVMSQTSFVLKGGGWYVSDYGYRKGITEDGTPPPVSGGSAGDSAVKDKPAAEAAAPAATAKPQEKAAPPSTVAPAPAPKAPKAQSGAAAS